MPSVKHFVIEGSSYGIIHVRLSDSEQPLVGFSTLERALEHVAFLNPYDEPEIIPPLKKPEAG